MNKDRFLSMTEPEPNTGCLLWIGGGIPSGYGVVYESGRHVRAHRMSYELFVGTIPESLCVLHACDTPSCVNPDHLWLGTKRENNADRDRKGRHIAPRIMGQQSHKSKLLTQEAIGILHFLMSGERQKDVAAHYGVDASTVSYIATGHTWQNIDREAFCES